MCSNNPAGKKPAFSLQLVPSNESMCSRLRFEEPELLPRLFQKPRYIPIAQRNPLLEAINVDLARGARHFLPETKLMMGWQRVNDVSVTDEADWMGRHTRKQRKSCSGGLPPSIFHAMRSNDREQKKRMEGAEERFKNWKRNDAAHFLHSFSANCTPAFGHTAPSFESQT